MKTSFHLSSLGFHIPPSLINMENLQTPAKKNTPRDVFLHLLAIITLYWSAGTFITLLFQFVNYAFPDATFPEYYMGPMRYAIASLIIVFPVFILVSWFLSKNYKKDPQIKEMRLRGWLIYFTLFATSLLIIGDLVQIVLTLLNGELTFRFILKALSIIIVAITIFGYYLNEVRQEPFLKNIKAFVSAVCLVVAVSIIGAFFVVGTPKNARLTLNDQTRVSNLQEIQNSIINCWQKKEKLPSSLADLTDSISGFKAPQDPEIGKPYEYNIKDANGLVFELCATFNKIIADDKTRMLYPQPYSGVDNWSHGAGRVCFTRTIDKQLYPPINVIK